MQSLNQCTSLCWPNVVLGMEASTLWSRIKKIKWCLCGSDVPKAPCEAIATSTGTKVTSELSKSDFVLLYLSFYWRPSVFTHFLVPKKTFKFFFWLQSSPGSSRIMVHWIPSLPFFSLSGTRITFNKLCSKPKTTPEKEEWKIPQKIVSEKNIKKLHSSTSCFENLFWVSLWCLKTKWMPSLRLSSPFLESFVFKVNSSSFFFPVKKYSRLPVCNFFKKRFFSLFFVLCL